MLNRAFLRNNDLGLLVLRICIGGLLLFHGAHKVMFGFDGITAMLAQIGLPIFLAYGAVLCETVAPVLIILGLWTRAGAFAVASNMVVAILMAHLSSLGSVDATTGGWAAELPALYLLGAVALCLTGGGKYAVTRGSVFD